MFEPHWDERLQCFVRTLRYNYKNHVGELHLPTRNAPDMEGVLELFRSIDPHVTGVLVTVGTKFHVVYVRDMRGRWHALDPQRQSIGDVTRDLAEACNG